MILRYFEVVKYFFKIENELGLSGIFLVFWYVELDSRKFFEYWEGLVLKYKG